MSSTSPNSPTARRPATKQCEVCHATFTRKTHLNRHMRSHTNDRSHQCKLCSSQFTRSDLLTRHKKICGGFRSRRKSCQGCAKAKSRCDLKTPSCSKCLSRGITCEYVTGPSAPRNANGVVQKPATSPPTGDQKIPVDLESEIAKQIFFPAMSPASDQSSPLGTDYDSASIRTTCSTPAETWNPSSLMPSTHQDFVPAINSSLMNIMDGNLDTQNMFTLQFPNMSLDSDSTYSSRSDPSSDWSNFYTDMCSTNQKNAWMPHDNVADIATETQDLHNSSYFDTTWLPSLDLFQTSLSHDSSVASSQSPSPMVGIMPFFPAFSISHTDLQNGTNSELTSLDHFGHLFFSTFLNQLPLVHIPTWRSDDKPEILTKAMQLCGALYVKSPDSDSFVAEVLQGGREEIIMNFVRQTDPIHQSHLILAIVLMQTVGLFHQQAEQRHSSAMYHAMVSTMISRSPAFLNLSLWTPPSDFSQISSLDQAWHDWIRYESAKRLRCLLYLHDCCLSIYFATPPTGSLSFDLFLPCETALWNASSSQEWYECLQKPSRYGTLSERLKGLSLQSAWANLVEQRPPTVTTYTSAFGHFILVHSALARIYTHMHAVWENGGISPTDEAVPRTIYTMQNALHNWLLNWQYEMVQCYGTETPSAELPFSEDALPFYWLGQISLLMLCEGKGRNGPHTIPDVRFRVIKNWLTRIRECLRSSRTAHAQFTNELMELRSQYTLADTMSASADHTNGLLEFFPVQV